MPKVTIYTTPVCPYCNMAKALLKSKNAEYTNVDVAAGMGLEIEVGDLRAPPEGHLDRALRVGEFQQPLFAQRVEGHDGAAAFDGLLQRMVALGLVAIGQTFVILVASIDLSVAAVVSAVAVLAIKVRRVIWDS